MEGQPKIPNTLGTKKHRDKFKFTLMLKVQDMFNYIIIIITKFIVDFILSTIQKSANLVYKTNSNFNSSSNPWSKLINRD